MLIPELTSSVVVAEEMLMAALLFGIPEVAHGSELPGVPGGVKIYSKLNDVAPPLFVEIWITGQASLIAWE